jgi:hypothetical protein
MSKRTFINDTVPYKVSLIDLVSNNDQANSKKQKHNLNTYIIDTIPYKVSLKGAKQIAILEDIGSIYTTHGKTHLKYNLCDNKWYRQEGTIFEHYGIEQNQNNSDNINNGTFWINPENRCDDWIHVQRECDINEKGGLLMYYDCIPCECDKCWIGLSDKERTKKKETDAKYNKIVQEAIDKLEAEIEETA